MYELLFLVTTFVVILVIAVLESIYKIKKVETKTLKSNLDSTPKDTKELEGYTEPTWYHLPERVWYSESLQRYCGNGIIITKLVPRGTYKYTQTNNIIINNKVDKDLICLGKL